MRVSLTSDALCEPVNAFDSAVVFAAFFERCKSGAAYTVIAEPARLLFDKLCCMPQDDVEAKHLALEDAHWTLDACFPAAPPKPRKQLADKPRDDAGGESEDSCDEIAQLLDDRCS